jgi:hypothetical protein
MPVHRVLISNIARNHTFSGLCVFKQRPRRQARLVAAVGALEPKAIALPPHMRALAACAGGCAAPARLDPIGTAVLFGCEPGLKLCRRFGKIPPQIVIVSLHHDTNSFVGADIARNCAGTKGIGMGTYHVAAVKVGSAASLRTDIA